MEKYKLSENIDKNKIFIVNRSEIEGRLDPYFYKDEFEQLRVLFENKGFIRIGDVLNSWNRGDGPRDGFYTNDNNGVFFLRVNNLKDNTISLTDVKFIHRHIHDKNLKRTQVKAGDLIFAISGTKDNLGTVSIIPDNIKEANLNSALVRLDLDSNRILNEFFCILFDLKFIRTQIDFIGKGTAQNNLNNKEITSIKIPNFSIEKQREIVSYFSNKKILVKQKEAEAKRLLDSIDDYLLGELGIVLPNEEDLQIEPNNQYGYSLNTENPLVKKGRLFLTGYRKIEDKRWDAFEIINANKKVEGGIYSNKNLKQLSYLNKGQSITSDKIIAGEYPVIAGGQTSPYSHNQYNYEGNIITVSASGAYSGYVWYHNYPIFASDCIVIFSKNENELSTLFLSEILKLKQKEIYNLQQGAGQPHVYVRDLEKLNIPLPPLKKQQEIADKISQIRVKALQLQQEATQILEQTKLQIEQMILGD